MQNRKSCLKWMCYGAAFCAMSVLAACDTVQFGDDDAASATTPVEIAKNRNNDGSDDKGRQNAPEPVKDGNTQPGNGGSNNNNADNSKSRDNQGDSNRGTGDDSTGGGDSNNKNTGKNNGGDNKGGNNRDTGGSDGKDRQDAPEPVKNDDESKKDNEGEDGDRGTGGGDDNGQPGNGGSNNDGSQDAPPPENDGNGQPGNTGGSNNNNADNSKSRDNQGDSNRGGGSNDKDRQNAPEPVKDGNTQPGNGGSNNNNADNSKSRDNQGDSNRGTGDDSTGGGDSNNKNTGKNNGGDNKGGNTRDTGGSDGKDRQDAPEPVKNDDESKKDNEGEGGDRGTGGGDDNGQPGNGGSNNDGSQDAPEPVKDDDESKKGNQGEDGDRGTGGGDDNGQPGNTDGNGNSGGSDDDDQTGNTDGNGNSGGSDDDDQTGNTDGNGNTGGSDDDDQTGNTDGNGNTGGSDDDDQTGNTDGNTGTDETDATRKSSEPKKNAAQSTPEREKTFWKSTEKYAKEYDESGVFAGSNAANGLPTGKIGGDGVVVGVIDTGIDFNHPELKGAEAAKHPKPSILDQIHGTGVAGVIAARRNGYGMHGVAPYAKLVDLTAAGQYKRFSPSALVLATRKKHWTRADIVNMSFGSYGIAAWTQSMQLAASKDVIMVIAAGNWKKSSTNREEDKAWEKPYIPASLVGKPKIKGWGIAVGNLDTYNPHNDPAFVPRYRNSVDKDGKVLTRSYFCGPDADVQRYCIFAPGSLIYTTAKRDSYKAHDSKDLSDNYNYITGTSAAAPVVSGYLANLMSAFPSRKGQKWNVPANDASSYYNGANWYVARLLSTAQDLGDKGVDKVYGVGMVDGTNMFLPQGTTSAVTSSGHFTMAQTQAIGDMRLGTGIANLGQAAALNQVLVYDEHRAPFLMNLQGRVERTQPSSSSYIADFVKRLSALDDEPAIAKQPIVAGMDMAFGFTLSQHQGLGKAYDTASLFDTAETPIALAATSDPLAFSMGTRTAMGAAVSLSDTMTLSFSASSNRKPDESPDPSDTTFLLTQDEADAHRAKLLGRLGLNYEGEYGAFQLQSGILHEKKGLFDTTGSDALAFARDARASYVQLGARIPLTDRIDLLGSYTQGWAAVDEAGESMWRGHEDMRFNAFTLGASYKGLFDTTDKLSFTVGQPLRLTSGSVYLRKAPGERNGAAYLVDAPVDLSPEDRELMFQLAYQVDIARRARLSLGGYYRINPGHDKRQPDDFGIGAKFSMRF